MGTKVCNVCNKELVISDFPCRKGTGRPSGGKCKVCYANHSLSKKRKKRAYTYRAKLTELEKADIVSQFSKGVSYAELATWHRVNKESIRKVLRKAQVPLLSKEQVQERSERAIEKQLGVIEQNTGIQMIGLTKQERRRASEARSRARVQDAIFQALKGKSCVDCGEDDILVLQFDHRDPKEKKRNVSDCSTATSALREIQKCDIVCANCHSKRTQKMFGSWRNGIIKT